MGEISQPLSHLLTFLPIACSRFMLASVVQIMLQVSVHMPAMPTVSDLFRIHWCECNSI